MSFTITCPICGKRNLYEFRFGGEDRGPRPEETDLTPETWAQWAMMNDNVSGIQKEWWYHRDGCGAWFTVLRDTCTNREMENGTRPHDAENPASNGQGRPYPPFVDRL